MTIIHIRGTSGSGKSTIVRSVMARYDEITPIRAVDMSEGGLFLGRPRKQPVKYVCQSPGKRALDVIGHYEAACGGCDTIASLDEIYRLVEEAADDGCDVLFEGLLISAEQRRTRALHERYPGQVHIIALDVDLDTCLESINSRRAEKAIAQKALGRVATERGPVNPKNTTSKHKQVVASCATLEREGLSVQTLGRAEALDACLRLLEID